MCILRLVNQCKFGTSYEFQVKCAQNKQLIFIVITVPKKCQLMSNKSELVELPKLQWWQGIDSFINYITRLVYSTQWYRFSCHVDLRCLRVISSCGALHQRVGSARREN